MGTAPAPNQQASTISRPGSAAGIRGQARRLSNTSSTHTQQQVQQAPSIDGQSNEVQGKPKLPDAPLGTGNPQRGSSIPRGGGIRGLGGAGRGMNPSAGTFTPSNATAGQKRGHDGEQTRGGGDKRAKGRGQ